MANRTEGCSARGSPVKHRGTEGMYLLQLWSDLLKAERSNCQALFVSMVP